MRLKLLFSVCVGNDAPSIDIEGELSGFATLAVTQSGQEAAKEGGTSTTRQRLSLPLAAPALERPSPLSIVPSVEAAAPAEAQTAARPFHSPMPDRQTKARGSRSRAGRRSAAKAAGKPTASTHTESQQVQHYLNRDAAVQTSHQRREEQTVYRDADIDVIAERMTSTGSGANQAKVLQPVQAASEATLEDLSTWERIPFDGRPLKIMDCQGRLLLYRSDEASWLARSRDARHAASLRLAASCRKDKFVSNRGDFQTRNLGFDMAMQDFVEETALTREVDPGELSAFRKAHEVMYRHAENIVKRHFPNVYKRLTENPIFLGSKSTGTRRAYRNPHPPFHFHCVNGRAGEVTHTGPHFDAGNTGVCMVWANGVWAPYDHWMRFDDLKKFIELPPDIAVVFSSAFMLHANDNLYEIWPDELGPRPDLGQPEVRISHVLYSQVRTHNYFANGERTQAAAASDRKSGLLSSDRQRREQAIASYRA